MFDIHTKCTLHVKNIAGVHNCYGKLLSLVERLMLVKRSYKCQNRYYKYAYGFYVKKKFLHFIKLLFF